MGDFTVQPLPEFVITPHAAFEMRRRDIDEVMLRRVMTSPEQRQTVSPGRDVLQSTIDFGGKTYLVRVIVDVNQKPPEVVTVYRTSKLAKYWRDQP